MPNRNLSEIYRAYLACLNTQDWASLGDYVGEEVAYNGQALGLAGYRQAREDEFRTIPDLRFHAQLVVADTNTVAARLNFSIHPQGEFLGLPVNGKRIVFAENVFYQFEHGKIVAVWSVLDKAAIEAQLDAA